MRWYEFIFRGSKFAVFSTCAIAWNVYKVRFFFFCFFFVECWSITSMELFDLNFKWSFLLFDYNEKYSTFACCSKPSNSLIWTRTSGLWKTFFFQQKKNEWKNSLWRCLPILFKNRKCDLNHYFVSDFLPTHTHTHTPLWISIHYLNSQRKFERYQIFWWNS